MIIDMQEGLLKGCLENPTETDNLALLIQANCQLLDWAERTRAQVYVAENRGYGKTISALQSRIGRLMIKPIIISKITCSAFADLCTDQNAHHLETFKTNGRKTFVIGGVSTHACVYTTLLDIQEAGVQALLPIGAHASVSRSKIILPSGACDLSDQELGLYANIGDTSDVLGLIDSSHVDDQAFVAYQQKLMVKYSQQILLV